MSVLPEDATPADLRSLATEIYKEMGKVIVGNKSILEKQFIAVLADGHVLLEGVPGTAKTTMVKTMAETLSCEFKRIQFTPDLMPSDIIGTNIFDVRKGDFHVRKGPVFTNLLLADEINRAPPKTQAALLEAMEERHSTIDGVAYNLGTPFFVLATQNPVEQEGTYPLPEAQMDRFLLKLIVDYPTQKSELTIMKKHAEGISIRTIKDADISVVADPDTVIKAQDLVKQVYTDSTVLEYITEIVKQTRENNDTVLGASPRASIALMNCARARAATKGRDFIVPDDVKSFAVSVLQHRVMIKPESELDGLTPAQLVRDIIKRTNVPR